MLTFRKITPEDYDEVSALMLELYKIHSAARPDVFEPKDTPRTFEEFCMCASGEDRIALCAGEGGSIIAYALVKLAEADRPQGELTAVMEEIYVVPSARREKIGTMLYRMAEREARERGAVRLDLGVWSFNESAAAFYRKMGFSVQRTVMERDIRVENFERECDKH